MRRRAKAWIDGYERAVADLDVILTEAVAVVSSIQGAPPAAIIAAGALAGTVRRLMVVALERRRVHDEAT